MKRLVVGAAIVLAASAFAAERAPVEIRPGGVVRWSGGGVEACLGGGRRWAPLPAGGCIFPIDLLTKPGELELARVRGGKVETTKVVVGDYPYAVQHLEVDDSTVHLTAEDLDRVHRENGRIAPLWRLETEPRFTLPLAAPLDPLPEPGRFGSRRFFNGEPRSPHSGADFPEPVGTPIVAVADGKVMLAENHFFGGNSVFIDHGGGLVSMYMHLSVIGVEKGETVRRGEKIGEVGATGRVTGPHLHFGVRWHGERVDPMLLLAPPSELPDLAVAK